MTALALALLVNTAILALAGMAALRIAMRPKPPQEPATPAAESVVTIFPEMVRRQEAPQPAPASKPRFARTSEDQAAPEEKKKAPFMGERDTVATSDRTPDQSKPPLPAQQGVEPKDEQEVETTESRYQDGTLDPAMASRPPSPTPAPPPPPSPPSPANKPIESPADPAAAPGTDPMTTSPPPREKLLDGPNPVDVQVPKEAPPEKKVVEKPAQRAAQAPPEPKAAELAKPTETPKPDPGSKPAFKGYQRKTAVMGSISRTGRSALDVEDTPLGRYQAAISRAVEQEWQRNCVRHRDFITPGFLTVRFFVETKGRVRSVQFVGDMQTGEVQKGFTLNSIRDAKIPPMPKALRNQYDDDPLELIFRFYF